MKRHKITITSAFFLIIILLSIVQAIVSNRLSTSGIVLGKIEEETRYYKTENAALAEGIFLETSLNNIASRAAVLGFVKEKSPLVLTTSDVVAVRQ
ncbi:MAG: hypothetical protein A3B41_01115 [Candidatus Levybacteria bacterium RIFCSPLOWO2_01_FULL_37_26]|nr:MAG: hypothetical protein A3E40_04595 [Candidatus Levybacteria bacterium RIFCSPHIGHO2_12_FULL_37_9]OGH39461.1 MAG: hypothetical protein A3B41_01115 [Candidatus Levybacteria bacterium RIFCSPLOWO2_01_FULL_37_26]